MDVVVGPMRNLVPKLLQLQEEYKLPRSAQVESLARDLDDIHNALCELAQNDEFDPETKVWAREARELAYDIDDIVDNFLVRVHEGNRTADGHKLKFNRLVERMGNLFRVTNKIKARHGIASIIKDAKERVIDITRMRERYRVFDPFADSTNFVDPRLAAFFVKEPDLVGIDEQKDALIKMLTLFDDKSVKIVSIVGSGGLGKTTLAKFVYQKLIVDMNIYYKAFVLVCRKADFKNVFRHILFELDRQQFLNNPKLMTLDESQLIDLIQDFLKDKRYFIVMDDIWDARLFEVIRVALGDNNLGSKIMITTRRKDIAELAYCTYKIRPLLTNNSKLLFFRRLFGSQDKCPETLSELSDEILRKCEGVPLVINAISSMLAHRPGEVSSWQNVCNLIGSGIDTIDDEFTRMRHIFLISYYDLPTHLKTCFLYLSMYPEDYKIDRDRLIWRWICEGFIQSEVNGVGLYELGKRYFNDLINRGLVQPVVESNDEVYACRVDYMIRDLILLLSREEKFVTTSHDIQQMMSSERMKFRRLSLTKTTLPNKGVSEVRSIAFFGPCFGSMPSFSCLSLLRILDLEGCSLKDCGDSNKLYLGNLVHLRYLGLRDTGIMVLPGGIEKLQFLQVLKMDVDIELPQSIFGLRRLMCLDSVCCYPRPGNLLRNLTSIEVLDTLYLDEESVGALEALGHLMELTSLEIFIKTEMVDQSFGDSLMNSLGNLPRLRFLRIMCNDFSSQECWAPPPHLWNITPASFPSLTYLDIMIHTVGPEDFESLGKLFNLVALQLEADYQYYLEQPLEKFSVSADAFPNLRRCFFRYVAIMPSMFKQGAMPRVEHIRLCLRARDFFSDSGLDLVDDLAMNNLPSLRSVRCAIHSETDITAEEEANELKKALKHAADLHPNQPKLSFLKEIGRA